jgi:hypothetical protein
MLDSVEDKLPVLLMLDSAAGSQFLSETPDTADE